MPRTVVRLLLWHSLTLMCRTHRLRLFPELNLWSLTGLKASVPGCDAAYKPAFDAETYCFVTNGLRLNVRCPCHRRSTHSNF